jgi:manganese/zinc/iron transport system ATP- binding protein
LAAHTSAIDVVTTSTYGDIGWYMPVRKVHRERALAAMDRVGIADLAHRQISPLSGGQQRTFLARAVLRRWRTPLPRGRLV